MAFVVGEFSQKENSNPSRDMTSTQLKRFLDDDTFDSFDDFKDPLPELTEKSETSPLPSPDKFSPVPSLKGQPDSVSPTKIANPDLIAKDGDAIRSLLDELEDSMDDVGQIKRKYMPRIMPDDEEFNSSQVPVDTVTKREVQELIESIPKPMIQKPFQPGSSPNDEDNRFLCWNSTGIIRAQYAVEDQSIDVMFHDTEKHSSVNFKNEPNYTFGSLSDDVIVVGSNGKYGTGPSSIHGINLLEINRDQREWEVELPHVEIIEGLAAGLGFVAVATDQKNLRFFTNGGMQSYILTLPGQVVCMTAYERQLLLVYHNGAGHSDDQNLSMFVYFVDLFNNTIRQTLSNVPVSLSKRSPLAWIGFSDEGIPCSYDYSGMLRMYRHELGQSWIPLLDLRELTSSALDHHFVVGVSEMSQAVRAVKCKRSRYPDFGTETAEVFSFSLPLCDMDTDKGKLEEEHVRLRLAELSYKRLTQIESISSLAESANDANDKLLVNTILRLFAIYLREDKEELARSLVYMIPREHMSKLPEFAWKTNRRQYFIESLNRAIEEREQLDQIHRDDDVLSVSSVTSHRSFGKDLQRELRKSPHEPTKLKPIPLDKLMTNTRALDENTKQLHTVDDQSDDDDERNLKLTKRTKSVSYNLFSKKRPKHS